MLARVPILKSTIFLKKHDDQAGNEKYIPEMASMYDLNTGQTRYTEKRRKAGGPGFVGGVDGCWLPGG